MKKLLFGLLSVVFLLSCGVSTYDCDDGECDAPNETIEGPAGPTGATGATGSKGDNGDNGKDGAGCYTLQTTDGSMVVCGDTTTVLLNGKDGINGKDGASVGMMSRPADIETECLGGGAVNTYFIDVNNDGLPDQETVLFVQAVCNGVDGTDGIDGQDGAQGEQGQKGDKGDTSVVLLGQGNNSDFRHGWELYGDGNLILYELGTKHAAYDNNLAEWHIPLNVVFGLEIGGVLTADQAKFFKCGVDYYLDYHTTTNAVSGRQSKWFRQKLNQFNALNNYSDVQGVNVTTPYVCP